MHIFQERCKMETMKPSELKLYENEAEFEQAFAKFAKLEGLKYYKIPDVIPQKNKRTGQYYIPTARKRPFDGILSTEFGLIALEFKYQNGRLLSHQWKALQEITETSGSAFVLRYKWTKRKGSVFTIEVPIYSKDLWIYNIYDELDALLSGVVELKQRGIDLF